MEKELFFSKTVKFLMESFRMTLSVGKDTSSILRVITLRAIFNKIKKMALVKWYGKIRNTKESGRTTCQRVLDHFYGWMIKTKTEFKEIGNSLSQLQWAMAKWSKGWNRTVFLCKWINVRGLLEEQFERGFCYFY